MKSFRISLALLALAGCRSEIPSADTVCWASVANQPDACEDQMCVKDVQRHSVASSDPADQFECRTCGREPAELSTDDSFRGIGISHNTVDFAVSLSFDNRVLYDWSLDTMRTYAAISAGRWNGPQGEVRWENAPYEILAFNGQRIQARIYAELNGLEYSQLIPPVPCQFMGQPTLCPLVDCKYASQAAGGAGESSELILEINLPFKPLPIP